MFRLLLKIIVGIIQIPLTILYFVLNLIGGVLSGAGWIFGVIVFMITGICWLFGQFDIWYQPLIGIAVSLVLCFFPSFITEVCSIMVLIIKGKLNE